MSYYLLPKIHNDITICPTLSTCPLIPYTSFALLNYFNEEMILLNKLCVDHRDFDGITIDNILKLINPYEFVFSKVPGSKYSVSKLKPKSSIFYDLLEILNNSNIFEPFKNSDITTLHITDNYNDSLYCYELLRETKNDVNVYFPELCDDVYVSPTNKKVDVFFYEMNNENTKNINKYTIYLLKAVLLILKRQGVNGTSIIKIDSVFHKSIIDILFILNTLFEKTYIIKPSTSNITSFEKYIVCKCFILNEKKQNTYEKIICTISNFIKNYSDELNIISILNEDLPYYFINKIDDMNNIIGQLQLETFDQAVNIFKNKNRDEKIESIRKSNIQKSVNWCEKHKIPCNKFTEKTNIFLPFVKDVSSTLYNQDECNGEETTGLPICFQISKLTCVDVNEILSDECR